MTDLERVARITEAETKLSFILKQKPTHAFIDPRHLLIKRNVTDNVKKNTAE